MKQTLLILGLFSTFLSCNVKNEINNIHPYIITDAYPKEQTLFVDTLGNGLYLTLVYDEKGLVRNVTPKELEESGMTITQLKDSAISNLAMAVKNQQVTTMLYKTNDSIPFALFTDSWLSASCIMLPDLKEKLSKHLNSESLYVCIPNRDAMLVFPKLTEGQKLKTQQFIKERESGATKPLSFEFFEIVDHKIIAVK